VVVIGETLGNPEVERLLVEEMVDRQVDGILYATHVASNVALPERLRSGRTVLLNCCDPGVDVPAVMPDDVHGGSLAAQRLVEAGASREVYVVGEDPTPEATAGRERMLGITRALDRAGTPLAGVVSCAWDVEPAFEAVHGWLGEHGVPSAFICLNDRVGMGVYQALEAHGIRVPDDIAVVSFDGSDLSHWLRPRLTSVALPFGEMGTRAVEILMDPARRTAGVTRMPTVLLSGASV
jgi:LacI family transcriptional regulator